MKYLTFAQIKAQLRLDDDIAELERDLLENIYGCAAEDAVLNLISRSYTEVIEEYGEVPIPIVQATLMLVDNSYKERSPVTSMSANIGLYGFDMLLKPYMKLTTDNTESKNKQYGGNCNL